MRRSRRSDVLAYWIFGSMPQTVQPDLRISAVAICQHVRCPRTRICVKSDVQRARYGTEEREYLTSEKANDSRIVPGRNRIWSGRRGSNPRPSAWEVQPLRYEDRTR